MTATSGAPSRYIRSAVSALADASQRADISSRGLRIACSAHSKVAATISRSNMEIP